MTNEMVVGFLTLAILFITGLGGLWISTRTDRREVRRDLVSANEKADRIANEKNQEILQRQAEILEKLEPIKYYRLHRHNEKGEATQLSTEGLDYYDDNGR